MDAHERPPALQTFLDAVKRGFESAPPDRPTKACLERVFKALSKPRPVANGEGSRIPAADFLADALESARLAGGQLKELADRIADIGQILSWRRRGGGAPMASASFADGHANAMIVGPGGLENRKDVWVGISLLAPGVRYPDHSHSPEEIYLVLTDGRFRQGERDWFTPGVGGTFYNQPNIVHAMASSTGAPLLAVWCLFEGSVG